MSSKTGDDFAIRLRDVSKHYLMYERPEDRLKQMLLPRLARAIGQEPKRYFRDFSAVTGLSLDIGHGETVGIIGRNGSGKSTLLQMICGTLQPTSGTIEVRGRIAALLELGAGFNPEFTGRENVYLNGAILGLSREEIDEKYERIVAFADIGHFISQPVKTYSSGMYVRLAFAVAINVDPAILIVDEALSVGDEAFQRKCFARIEAIKEQGATILFVSHGAQTIVQLCDRAVLLDAGEKLLEGEPKRVVGQYQRLINLSGAEAIPAREEIRAMNGLGSSAPGERLPERQAPAEPRSSLESFDPNLVSQSQVEYPRHGAFIRALSIRNQAGAEVNVLQRGNRYVFSYLVDFDIDASNVSFGFLVKTVSGLELAGTGTIKRLMREPVPRAAAGSVWQAQFEWDCRLAPGVYFLNAGVGTTSADGDVAFHRILDAYMFRVAVDDDINFTGIVDLAVTTAVFPHTTPSARV